MLTLDISRESIDSLELWNDDFADDSDMPSPSDWASSIKDASYKKGLATKSMNTLDKQLAVLKDCLKSGHRPGSIALKDLENFG